MDSEENSRVMDSEENSRVMDNEEKSETMRSSEHLCGKATNRTTKSQAKQQGCPSDLHRQELRKERCKLDVPNECKQPLAELSKSLDFRSMGAAVDWILPSETKRLTEVTKELGYDKGGQTLDWLISLATKPMLELNKLMGFEDSPKAMAWLLEQPCIRSWLLEQFQTPTFQHPGEARDPCSSSKQQPLIAERIPQPPAFGPAANYSVPQRPLVTDGNATGSPFDGGEIRGDYQFPSTANAQPRHEFGNSSGLQRGQATNQHLDRKRGMADLSNSVKWRGIEAGHNDDRGNQSQTPYLEGINQVLVAPSMNPVINQGIAPENEFEFENIHDWSSWEELMEGTEGGTQMGMPVNLGVYKNSIVSGDTILQNHGNQYFDQPSINQVLIDPSMNPVIDQGIAPENESENIDDWNRYQNQGGTQMGGAHGRHGGPHQ
jgi:hypothetical protein